MSSQLRVDKIVPVDGAPTGGGGGIIQIVQTVVTAATFTHNSETPTLITGMAASITPKFTTSKILVSMDVSTTVSAANYPTMFFIYKDGSVVSGARGDAGESNQLRAFKAVRHSGDNVQQTTSGMYLDSPSTTSAITYQIYVAQESGSTVYLNKTTSNANVTYHPRLTSSITLMEVSA